MVRLVGPAPPSLHAVAPLLCRDRRNARPPLRRWPPCSHPPRLLPRCGGISPRPRRAPRPPSAHHDSQLASHRRRCRRPCRRRRPGHRRAGPSWTRFSRVHRRRRRHHVRATASSCSAAASTPTSPSDSPGAPFPSWLATTRRPRRWASLLSRPRRPRTRFRGRNARSALRRAHCAAGWPRSRAPSRTTTVTPRRCPPRSCSHHSRRPSKPLRGASRRWPWPSSSTAPRDHEVTEAS